MNSGPGGGLNGGLTGFPARLLQPPGAAVLEKIFEKQKNISEKKEIFQIEENTSDLGDHHVSFGFQVVSQLRPNQLLLLPLLEYHQYWLHPVHSGSVLPPKVLLKVLKV